MIQLPTTPDGIRAAKAEILAAIVQFEAIIKFERAKLAAIQSVCSHPKPKTWDSNAMGRWPAHHFKCEDCGYYRET